MEKVELIYKIRKTRVGRFLWMPINQIKRYYRHYGVILCEKLGLPINTFSMKNEWLKTYERNPLLVVCSDKIAAKDYVAQKIGGGEYLIDTIKTYHCASEIDFNELPDKFVLKTNNASSTNIICLDKSKLDFNSTRNLLDSWLDKSSKYGLRDYIWFYKKIPPMILCEKLIGKDGEDLRDYKFWCFNGKPVFVWIDVDRYGENKSRAIYTIDWERLDLTLYTPDYKGDIEKPKNYEKMVELAKILSDGFKLVRVDFYNIDGKIYFGEMTFASGDLVFNPRKYDRIWGSMLDIGR